MKNMNALPFQWRSPLGIVTAAMVVVLGLAAIQNPTMPVVLAATQTEGLLDPNPARGWERTSSIQFGTPAQAGCPILGGTCGRIYR